MPKKPKSFKELKAMWYKKLDASGFQDIEERHVDKLKDYHSYHFRAHEPIVAETKRAYFEAASDFLNFSPLKGLRRRIWELHAAGKSVSEIGKEVKLCKSSVQFHINKVRALMKATKP